MKRTLLSAFIFLVLCGPAAAGDGHAKRMADGSAKSSPFTLKQVMQDLAWNVARIQQGVLTNNRLMIKEGGKAIATHPKPAGGIKPYVKKNAEDVKEVIPVMDKRVHHTSRQIAEGADNLSMADLQGLLGKMVSGCVGCHDMFRD